MIEVEKKFSWPSDLDRLLEGATFKKEITNNDTYYDTKDFTLARKQTWFRMRNGEWELKVPLKDMFDGGAEMFNEIEGESAVRAALTLPSGDMQRAVEASGYQPFSSYTVTRKTYVNGDFHIDVDDTSYGFKMVEIEVMVENDDQKEDAEKRIVEFAKSRGLNVVNVYGKLFESLRANHPQTPELFIAEGIIPDLR